MVKIYCIEDINDLKYVGSTKNSLARRLNGHKNAKQCSSRKLNLFNCIMYELETCEESNRLVREKYWIHKIDCVNKIKYDIDTGSGQYFKDYYSANKDKRKNESNNYYHKNKEEVNRRRREKHLENKDEINRKRREK